MTLLGTESELEIVFGTRTGATTIYVTSTETWASTHTSTSQLSTLLSFTQATVNGATTIYVTSTRTWASTHTSTSGMVTDVASSTSSGATVSSDAPSASDRLSTGAKAGIGAGVSLGIVLLGALVAYTILLRRRLKKASRENALRVGPAIPPLGIPELGTEGQKHELMGDKAWPEPSPKGTDGKTHVHELES
jgi:hypothetical protein